jgi:hypothetical protein
VISFSKTTTEIDEEGQTGLPKPAEGAGCSQ